jgi:hypothetical protein
MTELGLRNYNSFSADLVTWIPCENLCERILPKSARIGENCLRSAKGNSRSLCNLREMRRL